MVIETSDADSTIAMTYTDTGQRASVINADGTVLYRYDLRDRLVEKTEPNGRRLNYTYDAAGNLTSQVATVGEQILASVYVHDALNRLQSVQGSGGGLHRLEHDVNGWPVALHFPNGTTTTWAYDDLGRLTDLETHNATPTLIDAYRYTLSARGLRQRVDEFDGTSQLYTYDALSRLTEEKVLNSEGTVAKATSYQYDPVGNRTEKRITGADGTIDLTSYQYDVRNRLIAEGSTVSTWDANGNLLSQGTRSYSWDAENRLRKVMEGTKVLAEADYDADGEMIRLIEQVEGDVLKTTEFLVDQTNFLSHSIAELNDQRVVQTAYIRGGDHLLGAYHPATDTLTSLHLDGLGSIRMLTDSTSSVVARQTYGAFGERSNAVDIGAFGFAGERFASSIGLAYHRARWLDSSTGRFISVDPISGSLGSPLSQHPYLYAHANPVSNVDPSGLFIGGGGMAEFNVATAVQGVMVGLNATSLVGNTFYALAYGKRASRALLAGEIFDGLAFAMAGILYSGFAVASLVGLLTAFTPIPPPSGFSGGFALAAAGGSQATQAQAIWTTVASNQKLLQWALNQVIPAILGSHLLFATAANGGVDGGNSGGTSSGEGTSNSSQSSEDPGLDDFIDRLEKAGIEVENVNIEISGTADALGEVDIVTKNALIQYKNGPSSAYAVIKQVTANTEPHVTRPVVAFINDTGKAGIRTVKGAGGKILVTNDFQLLVDVIK